MLTRFFLRFACGPLVMAVIHNGIDHRHDDQGDDRGEEQAADYGDSHR